MPKMIAMVIELVIFACALWVLSFLSFFFHEIGHAIGYMIATRDKHWHVRVGWGKRLIKTKRLTVNLIPLDGFFKPLEEGKVDALPKMIAMLLGGPITSLLLVIGLALLKFGDVSFNSELIASSAIESVVSIAFFFNLFILVLSALPTHYFFGEVKGLESDGLQIVNAIKSTRRG